MIYSIGSASPQERHQLYTNIVQANPFWIVLSIICALLSHLSRAYRWKFLIHPMGYSLKFSNSFMAVMAAYLANLGIPRSGEVLRAATVAGYEEIPFEKTFGTIIAERVADLVMLLLIVSLAIISHADVLLPFFEKNHINPFWTILILIALVVLGILFLKIIRRSSNPFLVKLKEFGLGILEGMRSILKMKKNGAFILHTFFIWGMYVLMFYIMKFAIPATANLSLGAILVAFVVGSFAISITNGGIGIYPIAVGAILMLFGISKEAGEAFGWVVWGTQTLLNLVVGGLSLLLLPVLNSNKNT